MSVVEPGRWRRSLAEMILIVVSILLAFALDAWWDERERLGQEREELQAIRDELLRNIEHVEQVSLAVAEHAANVDALLEALDAAQGGPVTVPNEWLGSAITWRTSDVSTSTIDAIRESGGLRGIGDPGLRSLLAGFGAELQDVVEDEEIGRNFVEYELSVALARLGLGRVAYAHRLGFREESHGGESAVSPSPELLGLLMTRRVHWHFSEAGLPSLAQYMRVTVAAIDQYLAGDPVSVTVADEPAPNPP